MADMVDCGYHSFMAWARQTPSPAHGKCWHDLRYGPFNPNLPAEQAVGDMKGRCSEDGLDKFKRGWEKAQKEFLDNQLPNG